MQSVDLLRGNDLEIPCVARDASGDVVDITSITISVDARQGGEDGPSLGLATVTKTAPQFGAFSATWDGDVTADWPADSATTHITYTTSGKPPVCENGPVIFVRAPHCV